MRKPSKLWVIKAGSQMVIDGGPRLVRIWMRQSSLLKSKYGIDVIWVTSGAIATARIATSTTLKRTSKIAIAEKQAFSAIGQPMVMDLYNKALHKEGRLGSQVLLTADDLANKTRRTNLISTLQTLLAWGVLPIINENDAVATEEIQFGDNDRLSALVAGSMKAERLILLTDVEGLYDSDPKKNPDAVLVHELKHISKKLISSLSGQSPSGVGTGGMLSKILAAQTARRYGIITHLVKGNHPGAILKLAEAARTSPASRPKSQIGTTVYDRQ